MAVDEVIVRAGPVAVPLDYTVPTGTEIIPRSISANINGANAAGAFVPVLEIIAPSGAVTAYCARRLSIAAGASVLASWFPGVAEADDDFQGSGGGGTISQLVSTLGTLTVSSPQGPTTSVDMPITGVAPGTYGDATNSSQVQVDAEGRVVAAASVPIAGGGSVVASDGWVPDSTETWTFNSFTAGPPAVGTFKIAGDLRAKYTVGTRIKLTQTTIKFFVVSVDPTYDGVNTTVTITAGTDYTLANAAITSNFHSYVINPQGWPGFFNYTPTVVGFAGGASIACYFIVVGRMCTVYWNLSGTSNSVNLNFTAPIATLNLGLVPVGIVVDNGVSQTAPGRAELGGTSGTGIIDLTKLMSISAGGWTAAGSKISIGNMPYVI